jgi:eukaryotic-like serine/threonine-protein kinase
VTEASGPAARLSAALADRYTIERELGQGGMATVYLAQDLKHDRQVAIKVLKPELAAVLGAERFVQEIKTTAALSHPHILPLFDSGSADGQLYYVMPYIEGETVRERLNRETQFGTDEAVKITTEVADALDYAHRHGVIHRDIKPENILLHDGRPMVMDFGIALAVSAAAGGRMTETGLSLGTPHYMSPEQATADKEITGRSDIYSLASVLYEMLTGNPPHVGSSAQQVIMKIVAEEAQPVTKFRKNVPPNVAAAIAEALEKLPADRFATAKEFVDALENPAFRHGTLESAGSGAVMAGAGAGWKSRATLFPTIVAMLLLIAALWGWFRPVAAPRPVSRQAIDLGPTLPGMIGQGAAIAPDGSAIVYTDTVGGRKLWIKERGQVDPRPLADLAQLAGGLAPGPAFSPDGRWIIYSDGGFMRVARDGGAPTVVSDSASAMGGAWLDNGTIVFVHRNADVLFRTEAGGGPTVRLKTDSLAGLINRIAPVPGANAVLLNLIGGPDGGTEVAVDLATGAVHPLIRGATGAWIVPGGDLVYARLDGGLYAAPFDRGKLALAGPSVSLLSGVQTVGALSDAVLGRDGTLLYVRGSATGATFAVAELVSVPRDGSAPVRLDSAWNAPVAVSGGLALSPDGSKLALSVTDSATGRQDLVVVHLPNGPATRLPYQGLLNIRPSWSVDSRKILYIVANPAQLWERDADGSGRAIQVAVPEKRPIFDALWSPDGKWIVYRTDDAVAGNGDILAARTSGDSAPVPLAATDADETGPALSPDGRWLAYTSSTTGRFEIYVRPFPDAQNGLTQVSSDGGTEPQWAHDGKSLFYRNGAGEMIAVDVTPGPTFTAGAHHPLFNASAYAANFQTRLYAVTPDDRHFIMVRLEAPGGTSGAAAPRLVLVRNWLSELRAKLKGKGGT